MRKIMQIPKSPPAIYLAGRVGGDKWKIAKPYDYLVNWRASDGRNHSEHDWGGGFSTVSDCKEYIGSDVHDSALKEIESCIGLVAYVYDTNAYGTIAEIAYAAAKRKSCHLIIRYDPKREMWDMKDAYWFVACFPGVEVYEVYCDCMAIQAIETILRRLGVLQGQAAALTAPTMRQL
jgi:hypothetical protein